MTRHAQNTNDTDCRKSFYKRINTLDNHLKVYNNQDAYVDTKNRQVNFQLSETHNRKAKF